MSVSSISTSVTAPVAAPANNKTPAAPVQQAPKPAAPPAPSAVADSDADHDGSSGAHIDVKA